MNKTKSEKYPLDLTTWRSLVTLASIVSVKQGRQDPKVMGQEEMAKVNMDNSRNFAET